jgi:hypothetical protein
MKETNQGCSGFFGKACTGGQNCVNNKCQCPSGQNLVNGVCTTPTGAATCKSNEIWNSALGRCQAKSTTGSSSGNDNNNDDEEDEALLVSCREQFEETEDAYGTCYTCNPIIRKDPILNRNKCMCNCIRKPSCSTSNVAFAGPVYTANNSNYHAFRVGNKILTPEAHHHSYIASKGMTQPDTRMLITDLGEAGEDIYFGYDNNILPFVMSDISPSSLSNISENMKFTNID